MSPIHPGLPDFVDRRWVEDALARHGIGGLAALERVTFEEWIGTGQMGRSARLGLGWADPTTRPSTLVVKLATDDTDTAAAAFAGDSYRNELAFYERIAKTIGCRMPTCYATEYRPDELQFALLMEDVADAVQGDQFEGLDDDRLDFAIGQAVALHAPRWGDPTLPDDFADADGNPPADRAFAEAAHAAYGASVEVMVDRLGGDLDDEVIQAFRDLAPSIERWILDDTAPKTVMHGDFRADNFLFGTTESAAPLVVVDWQTARVGSAGNDLAYLISGSIPDPERRATVEPSLVDSYRVRLAEAGVTLDESDLWRQYRLGSIWGLLITAVATMSAARTERGDAMFTVMAQRHGWQVAHLDPGSLLD